MLITNILTYSQNKYWLYFSDGNSSDILDKLTLPGFIIIASDDNFDNVIPDEIQDLIYVNEDNKHFSPINISDLLDSKLNKYGKTNLEVGKSIFISGIPYKLIPQGSIINHINNVGYITSGKYLIEVKIISPQQQIFEAKITSRLLYKSSTLNMLRGRLSSGTTYQLDRSLDIDEEDKRKLIELKKNEDKKKSNK